MSERAGRMMVFEDDDRNQRLLGAAADDARWDGTEHEAAHVAGRASRVQA